MTPVSDWCLNKSFTLYLDDFHQQVFETSITELKCLQDVERPYRITCKKSV